MASAEDRELRRHALRFLAAEPDGQQNSRVLFQQLLDYGHRITWREFDRIVLYLKAGGFVAVQDLEPEISAVRVITITKAGLDIVEGTVADPGILAPPVRQG